LARQHPDRESQSRCQPDRFRQTRRSRYGHPDTADGACIHQSVKIRKLGSRVSENDIQGDRRVIVRGFRPSLGLSQHSFNLEPSQAREWMVQPTEEFPSIPDDRNKERATLALCQR
jgi:hypothetical protein